MSASARRMSVSVAIASMLVVTSAQRLAFADGPVFDSQHCPPITECGSAILPEGCQCASSNNIAPPPPLKPPDGCDPDKIKEQLKDATGTIQFLTAPPMCQITKDQCEAMPGRHVQTLSDGTKVCAPNVCSKACYKLKTPFYLPDINICSTCVFFPIDPKKSVDPNDKSGPLGAAAAQFVAPDVPLSYAIHFENLSTATAPAQVVVVTDQLDPQAMDLDTFRLGPIAFGENTLLPAPGVKGWTGGMDLRPRQNLIVTINAGLDKTTGLVTWRFTSIDPDTGQLTDDPGAGFLPPNTTPPAGEGSVVFTVMPKSGLATGTAIRNQAVIVFDTNAPIATPTWLNTLDNDKPSSHVLPLPATESSSSFQLQWTGSDVGAGIQDYTIFVSRDAGPFTPFLTNTTDTSATFTGQQGSRYAFYSIASDQAGNVEGPKTPPDATTQVASAQQLTALSPAKVWVGLKNSDDVGTNFDLMAQVYKGATPVGSGQLNGAAGGSSGFNNAKLDSIPLTLPAPVDASPGSTFSITVSARISCSRAGHVSGTARLWFNGAEANSDFGATIGGVAKNYYLLNGSILSTSAGPGPEQTVEVFLNNKAACPGRRFTPFGTWRITLP